MKADICDREAVFALFEEEQPDVVVNFAAESHVDRSIEDPGVFLQTNILGTQVLMDACRKYGMKRYHQVSTDEVYGDLPLDRPDLFFTEETPIHTSSPYSASKASADLLVLAYHRTYGLPVTISPLLQQLRAVSLPGETDSADDHQLPERQAAAGLRHGRERARLAVCGGSLQGHRPDPPATAGSGEVYNIGGHNEMRNIDIVRLICKALGKPESLITYVTDRKGHDLRYAIDPTKIHNELGWLPETKFADGIKKTIRVVSGEPGLVGERSSTGSIRTTTSACTRGAKGHGGRRR